MFAPGKHAVVRHTVRYDDLSAVSDEAAERGLVEILLRHRVPCTFAAIPFVCDPESLLDVGAVRLLPFPAEKAALVKPLIAEGLAEIALHGYAHLMLSGRRGQREFCDQMRIQTQQALIHKGRSQLEKVFGVPIRLFVPPWERADRSTLAVLEMERLSIPRGISVSIAQTHDVLRTAFRLTRGRSSVATVLHDYDLINLEAFEALLVSWLQIGNIERGLLADQPLDIEREQGNSSLRSKLRTSRLGRRLMPNVQLIDWDCATARRLTRWAACLP
jgi:hypothetical protein